MSADNVETVQRLMNAFQTALRRGRSAMDAVKADFETRDIATDAELIPARELTGPKSYRGLDGLSEFFQSWTEDFDDWSFEVERLIDAPGDRVVAVVRQSGTGKGSGVPVKLHFGQLFELEDGRVIRVRLYLTPAEAFEAAGLSE